MDKKIKRKRMTGSLPFKITVFCLMILCVGIGMFAGYGTMLALSEDVYEKPFSSLLEDAFFWQARNDEYEIYRLLTNGGTGRIDDYCRRRNIRTEIFIGDGIDDDTPVWSNYDPEEEGFWREEDVFLYEYEDFPPVYVEDLSSLDISHVPSREETSSVGYATVEVRVTEIDESEENTQKGAQNIRIVLYVNKHTSCIDEYYYISQVQQWMYRYANIFPRAAAGAIVAVIICFIFLMCSAGHRNEMLGADDESPDADPIMPSDADHISSSEYVSDAAAAAVKAENRIYPGFLQGIWLDVLLAVLLVILYVITMVASEIVGSYSNVVKSLWINGGVVTVWAMLTAFFGTLFCMELAIRVKRGGLLKHTLVYTAFRFAGRCVRAVVRGLSAVFRSLPALAASLAAFVVFSICEFMVLAFVLECWGRGEWAVAWIFGRILILAVICYFGVICGKLQKAGKALAAGDLSYHVDTSKMILGYKEHGNCLNSIGEGMAKAVAERMKSEHLKTELISNVSHDLKTPLTSIINYSDLLSQVKDEPEKVSEYTEVLHRQSVRLKKLLDDLLEVSKASTGNLSTDLAPCDVKVLIAQTTGEYEQRFAEKNLELIHEEPERDVHIMADHRHLFRIFDNLLGNICKYAQPGSRVYLNVESEDQKVRIIFRNMSEEPLNISGGELMERFVRGDKSRHKEGSGLGLSIAMSLAQLQGGSLQIITDGDLFKAVLEFPMQQG